jgi:itaconyl-CoA hydratase
MRSDRTSKQLTEREKMEKLISAYRELGKKRYRETSGLYYEDFEVGDLFEHRPGRTITDVDNIWMTLLTMNVQQVHFDTAYAAKTEWKKMLVDSTFTLALLTGMSVRTVSAKVVANLGWDKVKATHPVFAGILFMRNRLCCLSASQRVGPTRGSSPFQLEESIRTAKK